MVTQEFRDEIKIPFVNGTEYRLLEILDRLGALTLHPSRRVTSIYFDTDDLQLYSQSVEGVLPRSKTRLRTYSGFSSEAKIHLGAEFVLEIKSSHSNGDTKKITPCPNPFNLIEFGYFNGQLNLFAKSMVSYRRMYMSIHDVRLTVDTDIEFSSDLKNFKPQVKSEQYVLEIKGSDPKLIGYLVNILGFETRRFSKYCSSIDATRVNL